MRKKSVIQERSHTKTSLSLGPLSVDEALEALLETPPPALMTKVSEAKRRAIVELAETLPRNPTKKRTKRR